MSKEEFKEYLIKELKKASKSAMFSGSIQRKWNIGIPRCPSDYYKGVCEGLKIALKKLGEEN